MVGRRRGNKRKLFKCIKLQKSSETSNDQGW